MLYYYGTWIFFCFYSQVYIIFLIIDKSFILIIINILIDIVC